MTWFTGGPKAIGRSRAGTAGEPCHYCRVTANTTVRSRAASVSLVTAGSMTANAAGYLLQLAAGRALGPSGFGAFASLLAVQLVLAVPALALQVVAAREVVRGAPAAAVRALSWRCTLLVAGAAVVAAPVVTIVLHTGALATAAAVAAAPLLVILAGEQGILQGHSRFPALGLLFGLAGLTRVLPAVVVLIAGGPAALALTASCVGTALAALAARVGFRVPAAEPPPRPAATLAVVPVLLAAQAQGAVLALSSVDVLAAQLLLDRDAAGRYALGAVAAKIAFWLPQAVGVVLYPRLAHPGHSGRTLRTALAVLAALGALAVLGAAIAAPLASTVAGAGYAPIESRLWAFALNGALLALLQAALLAAIAQQRTGLALGVWAGLAAGAAAMVLWAIGVTSLLTITLATTAIITTTICLAAARASRTATP